MTQRSLYMFRITLGDAVTTVLVANSNVDDATKQVYDRLKPIMDIAELDIKYLGAF